MFAVNSPMGAVGESSLYEAVTDELVTLASMEPVNSLPDAFNENEEDNSLDKWTNLHPENWSPKHVADWLREVVTDKSDHVTNLGAEVDSFNHFVTGRDLCKMSREEFVTLLPQSGHTVHEEFRVLLESTADFQEPNMLLQDTCMAEYEGGYAVPYGAHETEWGYGAQPYAQNVTEENSTSAILGELNRFIPANYNPMYPVTPESECDVSSRTWSQGDDGYGTESDRDSHSDDSFSQSYPGYQAYTPWCSSPHDELADNERSNCRNGHAQTRCRCARAGSSDVTTCPTKNHRGRQSSKGKPYLWEFVRNLLKNPRHNNVIIKWEDRRNGVFRIMNSAEVARMWGHEKKNSGMTYEKLSRAMRYYYKRELLQQIDGRLRYKFGKKATGWTD